MNTRTISRRYTYLAIIAFAIVATTVAAQEETAATGKQIFEKKCKQCHGKDGAKGMFGAKNLQITTLNDVDMFNTITNGRRVMPAWKNKLTPPQIKLVISYIKTLHK